MATTNLIILVILMLVQTYSILSMKEDNMADSAAQGAVLGDSDMTTSTFDITQQSPETSDASDDTTGMTTEFDDTTISNARSGKNLPLILGLTLGLGIPATLGVIGGAAYYLKIYRPKHRVAV